VFDDLEPSEKLKIYDKGITLNGNSNSNAEKMYQMLIGYRTGDMWSPKLQVTEALKTEASHFIECIEQGKRPITDGYAGLEIVKILEAATLSMKQQGQLVELNKVEVAA
jgi:predicted dehydrogenase